MFGIGAQEIILILFLSIVMGAGFYFFNKTKKVYETKLKEPDSQYYEQAEQEIEDGSLDKGLWAKALVKAEGNEELRKIEYMKLRAKQLQINQQAQQ